MLRDGSTGRPHFRFHEGATQGWWCQSDLCKIDVSATCSPSAWLWSISHCLKTWQRDLQCSSLEMLRVQGLPYLVIKATRWSCAVRPDRFHCQWFCTGLYRKLVADLFAKSRVTSSLFPSGCASRARMLNQFSHWRICCWCKASTF